jgi:hypothetical protein
MALSYSAGKSRLVPTAPARDPTKSSPPTSIVRRLHVCMLSAQMVMVALLRYLS